MTWLYLLETNYVLSTAATSAAALVYLLYLAMRCRLLTQKQPVRLCLLESEVHSSIACKLQARVRAFYVTSTVVQCTLQGLLGAFFVCSSRVQQLTR